MWSWVLEAIGVIAAIVVGRHHWWGWLIMVFNSALWSIYGFTTKQYGFVASSFVFGITYLRNAYTWYILRKVHNGLSGRTSGETPGLATGESGGVSSEPV
jgi:hypothetical protein